MTCGVKGESRVNPWDFVLALEGALDVCRRGGQTLGGCSVR